MVSNVHLHPYHFWLIITYLLMDIIIPNIDFLITDLNLIIIAKLLDNVDFIKKKKKIK